MGVCYSSDSNFRKSKVQLIKIKELAHSEPELEYEAICRFLALVAKDPIVGHRFKDIVPNRVDEVATRMCTLLNQAFKYDKLYSPENDFCVEIMKGASEVEVDRFFDLFINECFSNLDPSSVQARVLNSKKQSIIDVMLDPENTLYFYSCLRSDPVLENRFADVSMHTVDKMLSDFNRMLKSGMDEKTVMNLANTLGGLYISGMEYDEFMKLLFEVTQVSCLKQAKQIADTVKWQMSGNVDDLRKLFYEVQTNSVLSNRFHNVQYECFRATIETMKKSVENGKTQEIDSLMESSFHVEFSVNEIKEFKRLFFQARISS